MTTIIRPDWARSSTGEPDLFASGTASFKNLRSRETSSTPRSWVCGFLKKTLWPLTTNTNSSLPCGRTSPKCSISSTASLQLKLWGSLPLRRFWYNDSRCLLMVRSPSQTILNSKHASRTVTIKPRMTRLKQLDLGIDVSGARHLSHEDTASRYESIGNTIVQLRGLLYCGRMNPVSERRR